MNDKFFAQSSPAEQRPTGTDREEGARPPRQRLADELIALDLDIMKSLAKRAKLVGKLRGGKEHAATPVAVKAEKEVRTAWEKNAARFSRDDKFSRQLFTLLQELRIDSRAESESRGNFNLAPSRKPVSVTLQGPADVTSTRLVAAVAAACGNAFSLDNILVNTPLVDCLKALNSVGARFTWTNTGKPGEGLLTQEASGSASPLNFNDKVLYLGDDTLTMYLVAFMAAGASGRVRFTGGTGLKMANLSPLRRFLPGLGARFAHNMPKSDGLPGRLEASGMIPDTITVPNDLPEEGVSALVCAAATWRKRVSLVCSALPASVLQAALASALPVLRECQVAESMSGAVLTIDGTNARVPEKPTLPLDAAISAYILALPAFAGGSVALGGVWDEGLPLAEQASTLLRAAGLSMQCGEEGVRVQRSPDAGIASDVAYVLTDVAPELLPLGLSLAALSAKRGKGVCPAPRLPDHADATIMGGFFAYLGFACNNEELRASSEKSSGPESPWTSPGPYWTMAYALAAYLHPSLSLTNPASVAEVMPSFWALYNALPDPSVAAVKKTAKEPVKRRRVFAGQGN